MCLCSGAVPPSCADMDMGSKGTKMLGLSTGTSTHSGTVDTLLIVFYFRAASGSMKERLRPVGVPSIAQYSFPDGTLLAMFVHRRSPEPGVLLRVSRCSFSRRTQHAHAEMVTATRYAQV